VAPDDGAYPAVQAAAQALQKYITDKWSIRLPIRSGYLNKKRVDSNTVEMTGPLLGADGQPMTRGTYAFILDDETAKGTTLIRASDVLVRMLGYEKAHTRSAVVQPKLNSGLQTLTEKLHRFSAMDSLPLPPEMHPDQVVPLSTLIPELVKWLRGEPGTPQFGHPIRPPSGNAPSTSNDISERTPPQNMKPNLPNVKVEVISNTADDPNRPTPELGPMVENLLTTLLHDASIQAKVKQNRAIEAMHAQTVAHLRNISFSLRTEIGNDDYPHDFVLKGRYPYRPTLRAIEKAQEFLTVLSAEPVKIVSQAVDPSRKKALVDAQRSFVTRIANSPLDSYHDFHNRLQKEGTNASFQEFGSMVEYLELELLSDPDVLRLCAENPALAMFRSMALNRLRSLPRDFPYLPTVYAVERAVEFFDVVRRAQSPEPLPPIYHSAHYEYYLHSLMGELPDHITIPTIAELGVTDLLKVRGVPIGFLGVKTESVRVDGFWQTPYELFVHDANHARRMFQLLKERALELGLSLQEFVEQSAQFVKNVLLPLFIPKKGEDPSILALKQVTKMVLFEFLHEQSFAADPQVLTEQILRPPQQRTPFERLVNDTEVVYYTEHRPTCLAYSYRKLTGDYYDEPTDRKKYIVAPEARTRENIVKASAGILQALGLREVPMASLWEYVRSDDFPNASFRKGLQEDIDRRPGETIPLGQEEDPSLQPLLLLKSQFQKTIQEVTPWDASSFRFLYGHTWQEGKSISPRIGIFRANDQPIRQSHVDDILNAVRTHRLDEVVVVLSRTSNQGVVPTVEDLALQALMIQASTAGKGAISIAVTGSDDLEDIQRNLQRVYTDPEFFPIHSFSQLPISARLRLEIADGRDTDWKQSVAPEAAALIDRWALYRHVVTPEERKRALQSDTAPTPAKSAALEPLRAMRSVFSYPFPEIRPILENLFRNYPYDILRGWITPPGLDHFQDPIIDRFLQFQGAALPELKTFTHRYPTAGANEGIREAMTSLQSKGVSQIYVLKAEYEGYSEIAGAHGIKVVEVPYDTDPRSLAPGWWFISNPSGRDGNIIPDDYIRAICDAGHHVFYDLAYLGLTDFHVFDLSHPNIAGVFISLSKSYGVFSYRSGFTFSREPIEGLSGNIWFKNILSLQIADAILREIPDPMMLPRLYRPIQRRIVAQLSARYGLALKASDVVLLAHLPGEMGLTVEQKQMMERYRRGDGFRLTLTPYFLEAEAQRPLHIKARQSYSGLPMPVAVPDERVEWNVPFSDYHPVRFTDPSVLENDRSKNPMGWADEADFDSIKEKVWKRKSFEGLLSRDPVSGMLLNPLGRTGKSGRGVLGAYGPNFAADPVITRIHPQSGRLQVVVVKRSDTGEWGLPGSMVNSSNELLEFMRRGFARKALGIPEAGQNDLKGVLDALFANGKVVYKGYMDDSRNTDNAWMESVAVQFHASEAVAERLNLQSGPGTSDVRWIDVEDAISGRLPLYANHADLLRRTVDSLKPKPTLDPNPHVSPPHSVKAAA
jgi:ADP-ribose pyrophosphatase